MIHFNRRSAFFNNFQELKRSERFEVGPYFGNTPNARLTIALHEVAHLLQDTDADGKRLPVSENKVPGFKPDGGDGPTSLANTSFLLGKCKTMIERP